MNHEFTTLTPAPHEKFILPAGFYEFRLAREFDPSPSAYGAPCLTVSQQIVSTLKDPPSKT
jgi:hypothetical protein